MRLDSISSWKAEAFGKLKTLERLSVWKVLAFGKLKLSKSLQKLYQILKLKPIFHFINVHTSGNPRTWDASKKGSSAVT